MRKLNLPTIAMAGSLACLASTATAEEKVGHRFNLDVMGAVEMTLRGAGKIHCLSEEGQITTNIWARMPDSDIIVSSGETRSVCSSEGEIGSGKMFCDNALRGETIQQVFTTCGYNVEFVK